MTHRAPHAAMLALGLAAASASATSTATYRVTFDATWSPSNHPGAYHSNAHFSPLIGAVHTPGLTLWESGGIATPGIEQMAETGGTSILRNEINAFIAAGSALAQVRGPGIDTPASTAVEFTATTAGDMTRFTFVTMIAPSPDWFIGVSGLELREGIQWRDDFSVELHAYDAGTDSGVNLTSPNANTSPQDPITDFVGVAPFGGLPALGTFTFELLSVDVTCAADTDGDGDADPDDITAFVDAFITGAADIDGDSDTDPDDISAFVNAFIAGCG